MQLPESYNPDVDYGFAWSPLIEGPWLVLGCGRSGLALHKLDGRYAWGHDGQPGACASPTPFTADEIRGACPPGRTIRLRVDVVGETPFHRVNRFIDCDQAGAILERARLSLDGVPLGEPEVNRVTWRDLQAHASFPADDTTIESGRIETAIGELDCLRYTVRVGATDEVFWFAMDLPGMPIQCLTRTDGEVVTTVSVVDNTMP